MAINAAKEFDSGLELPAEETQAPTVYTLRATGEELERVTRLARRPNIQRQFDQFFPNIANNLRSQANFDRIITDGPFDPETVGAFMILREARVTPHLVEVFNASEQPKQQSSAETPLHPDPSTFIG